MRETAQFLPEKLLEIFYSSNVGILIVNEAGKIVWGNRHYEKITSLKIAEILSKDVETLLPEISFISVVGSTETLRSAAQRERKVIHRIMTFKNRQEVITTLTPIFDGGRICAMNLHPRGLGTR